MWHPLFVEGILFMASFFSPDGKAYRFMSWLLDTVKLNVLWVIFSLPVVTIGISTIAAFDVSMKMVENKEGHIARSFVKSFTSNWKQGAVMSIIMLLCSWVIYLDFQIMGIAESNSWFFLVIGVVTTYIFVFSLLYAYPLLARYENTITKTIKNSFRISMRYFIRSFVVVLIVAFEIAATLWNATTLLVGVLVGPAIIILTISANAMFIFRDIEREPGSTIKNENLTPDA